MGQRIAGTWAISQLYVATHVNLTFRSSVKIELLVIIMFNCPVCKKNVEGDSRLDVGRHMRMHISTLDFPVAFPIQCCQQRCHSIYSSLDAFVKHMDKKHSRQYSNIAPIANDCDNLDGYVPEGDNEDNEMLEMPHLSDIASDKYYSNEAMKLILCLVSKSSMTFKCVTEVLAIFDNYMQSTLANIHNKLEKIENAIISLLCPLY
ncbi:hypothetical protein OUZ56_005964 [Daphnia magna]|uniref:C2H2-type domain-containing protein n=1 Tax=Daphnia magna TaxID=35525 RepID=A0ABQ9YU86_9CRUS|nr:hypothetical protein OUZ56_005964 [Daphnia magna]